MISLGISPPQEEDNPSGKGVKVAGEIIPVIPKPYYGNLVSHSLDRCWREVMFFMQSGGNHGS